MSPGADGGGVEDGSAVGALSAFYDLFVGVSSFIAGAVAKRVGYSAAFAMTAVALITAVIAGRVVFQVEKQSPRLPTNVLGANSSNLLSLT